MLRAYLFLLFYTPLTLALAASAIVFTLFDSTGKWYHRCARLWSRAGLRMAGVDVTATGLHQVPASGPVIFVSNHLSNFDILALYRAIPLQFAWIAKEELFKIPVFGYSMKRAGYIPLDRSHGRRALRSMEAAAAKIRGGTSVIIFPEGTRSLDGNLLPFKKGGFMLAARSGVPIVPVTINGSRRINPGKQIELHPGSIVVTFGPPIETAGMAKKDDELLETVRRAIEKNLEAP
jgi:1-acyl-sn-glycerol-3-phosphate acyltransferase